MPTLNTTLTKNVSLIFFGALLSLSSAAWAESDKELQEKALKAREMGKHGPVVDHSAHEDGVAEAAGRFRGVFYGYLPCHEKDCSGIKMTLSLKHNNTYLLVVQLAKPYNRESFEKGKYVWDDKNATLLLTPNKDAPSRRLLIKDDATLVHLNADGSPMPGNQDAYVLARSDKAGNREMHIH